MIKQKHWSLLLLFLLTFACTSRQADLPGQEEEALMFMSDYRPAVFTNPDRAKKIGKVLLEAHRHYRNCAEKYHIPGIAYGLVADGELVFSGTVGSLSGDTDLAVTERSLFRIASMTKSFTALAILKLRDEGKLRLDQAASLYLPEMEKLEYLSRDATAISIRNLLTMSAGFPEDNPWGDRFLDMADDQLMEKVRSGISFSTIPSVQYEYSNLGYGLLGQIIHRISGLSFQEYIRENILIPLDMTHTVWEYARAPDELLARGHRWEDGQWKNEILLHDGAFGSMGGMITSIEDFSKYVSFLLQAWPPRNDEESGPLKRSSLREMQQMYHPRFWWDQYRFGNPDLPLIRGYGYGLVVMKDQEGILEVGHNGGLPGFGSSYMFYPEQGIGIMAFANLTYSGARLRSANYQVLKELRAAGLFEARELPVSVLLKERQSQLVQLIQYWDPELEKDILAANFFLDRGREKRIKESQELLHAIGDLHSVGELRPENQMRGSFVIYGSRASMDVFFSLSPEDKPKVQYLDMKLIQ